MKKSSGYPLNQDLSQFFIESVQSRTLIVGFIFSATHNWNISYYGILLVHLSCSGFGKWILFKSCCWIIDSWMTDRRYHEKMSRWMLVIFRVEK